MRESAEAKGPMNITGTGVPKVSDLDLDMYLLWKQATSMILLSVFELNHLPLSGGSDGKESTCNAGELGWEDPLEDGMATHSSILAWRTPPWTEEPGGLQSMGSHRV